MKRDYGFTLVEIVLSISLVAILFSLSAILLNHGVSSFSTISQRGRQTQDARYAMERMMRELVLVMAGVGGDLNGTSATQISFKDKTGTNTDFHLNGQNLFRGNDLLLNRVTGLVFTGYRSDGTVTSSVPQTRRLRIQLTTLPQGETAALTLRSDIFLRTDMYVNFQ